MKLIGKRGKIYRQLLAEGRTEAYAKRVSKGLAEGKTRKEARGYHRKERYQGLKSIAVEVPKSRLDKKKEERAVYSYFDGVWNGDSGGSEIMGMTSYDITKTHIKNWEKEPLYAMHQYMERELQNYLKLELELAGIDDWNAEQDNDSQKGRRYRGFEWQLTDFTTGEIRFHLRYQKGQILEADMWEDFDRLQFKIEIRELKIWD